MKPLVITEGALNVLAVVPLSPEWFLEPKDLEDVPVAVRETSSGVYIDTPSATPADHLLVITRNTNGLFDGVPEAERRNVFERCMRLGLHGFNANVAINPKWMPFHAGNRLSVFAYGIGHRERIVAEVNAKNEGHVYIFAFGDRYQNLANLRPDYSLYDAATMGYVQLGPVAGGNNSQLVDSTFDLPELEQSSITRGFSYAEWYPRGLTRDQVRFVDYELTGPLRLRGAAGTGKTLAMMIKALKTKYDADAEGRPKRILFLTHSWAMAEHVDRLITAMDENPSAESTIDVFPLLTLAERADYAEIGREPLGIDSDEGKRLALKEIGNLVDEFLRGDWAAYRSSCSIEFQTRIETDAGTIDRRLFSWDLLVEFGCVIAAQGILTRSDDKEQYLRIRRQRWMLPLETAAEREVVFALWVLFMKMLSQKGYIQTDQMISDYLNELSTFYWDAARKEKGYDVIFVDEAHLFNSQERMVFHHLLREADKPPLVVLALDPHQSPRETFTQVTTDGQETTLGIYERARLPKSQKIDLRDVFRYTPQIGAVVAMSRDAAPGLDPMEDWDIPAGSSAVKAGPIPRYYLVDNAIQSFKRSMVQAFELNKVARENGGRVAVLCMDAIRFERFKSAAAGQYRNETFVIRSREDIEGLRYAGRKIVVSTPEYVAGLQFDTVILVDPNKNQVPEGKYQSFHLRRFLSELYLGLSRAQRELVIVVSRDEGGLSPVLKKAVSSGALIEADGSKVI